ALWGESARLVRELRPGYGVVETVSALLARGRGRVLGDLAACGYDAEWDCIPASAVGAPHRRDRVWLVAYPASSGSGAQRPHGASEGWADGRACRAGSGQRALADAEQPRPEGHGTVAGQSQEPKPRDGRALADSA